MRALEGRAEAGWKEKKLEEQFKVGGKMEAMLQVSKQNLIIWKQKSNFLNIYKSGL